MLPVPQFPLQSGFPGEKGLPVLPQVTCTTQVHRASTYCWDVRDHVPPANPGPVSFPVQPNAMGVQNAPGSEVVEPP